MRRPYLPPEFQRLNPVWTILFVFYAAALAAVPAWLATLVVSQGWPVVVGAAGCVLLAMVSSQGMHLLAFAGHEGIHLNLHRNKYVSMVLAILVSTPIATYMVIGYGATHWDHHRFTNQASDPDAAIYSQFRTFWSRMLVSRTRGSRLYMRNTLRLAVGRPVSGVGRMPFSREEMAWLARLNILVSLCWTGGYVLFLAAWPLEGLVAIVLPHVFTYFSTGLRAYVEHAGLEAGLFRDTRSYTSPFFTLLFFGNNYHLEHHLYPAVPCYRLPALHRHLQRQGTLAQAGADIEPSFWHALRYVSARFAYPMPVAPDDQEDDPFRSSAA